MATGAEVVAAESAIQNGMALLENNIDVFDKRMEVLWEKLKPVIGSCVPPEATKEPEKSAESPLLNQLISMKARTDKLILSFEELIQRIQC